MKSIAITGSFASGKTFVLKYLEKAGYKTFSCDDYVRELYSEPNIRKDILCLFDEKLFEKGFDKKKLSQIIYSDDNQRRKLEQYIHPKVRKGINDFQNKHLNEPLIFVEVPLLFETGFNSYFDYSICVYCSEESRKNRATERGDFYLKIYSKIKNIQLPQEKKKNLANFQINTDLDIEIQIKKIIAKVQLV